LLLRLCSDCYKRYSDHYCSNGSFGREVEAPAPQPLGSPILLGDSRNEPIPGANSSSALSQPALRFNRVSQSNWSESSSRSLRKPRWSQVKPGMNAAQSQPGEYSTWDQSTLDAVASLELGRQKPDSTSNWSASSGKTDYMTSSKSFPWMREDPAPETPELFRCSRAETLFSNNVNQWIMVDREFCIKKYPDLLLLIVAITSVHETHYRRTIRQTWGKPALYKNFKTAVIFPIGRTNNVTLLRSIKKEQKQFGDLIQQNFMDTYQNLTYKTLEWLQFVDEFCPTAQFVLKIDTDMTFNYFKLVWPVSEEEYSSDHYPSYCSGMYYVFTTDLVRPLLQQAPFCTFFWVLFSLQIEDVHVTGHLGAMVGANYEDWTMNTTYDLQKLPSLVKKPEIIFGMISSSREHDQLWKIMLYTYEPLI
uniref:Hexosyltransferase n=1 Tax=Gongylonema pulchrum TaxID=637853 RepID=A0A183CVE2_9BILA